MFIGEIVRFNFKCNKCRRIFEKIVPANQKSIACPYCGKKASRQFHACVNIHIPSYFHTSKSDIFSDTEWRDLKKNPDIERA